MSGRAIKTLPVLIVAALAATTVHLLHLKNEAQLKETIARQGYATNLIPDSTTVKLYALGFDRVIADFYWLAFIQYYGDVSLRLARQDPAALRDGFRQSPAFLRLVIELDPHFIQPYWFSSFVLGSELNLKKEAEDLLDYGIAYNLPTRIHDQLLKEKRIEGTVRSKIASIAESTGAPPYDSPEDSIIPYIAGFNQFWYSEDRKTLKKNRPDQVKGDIEPTKLAGLQGYQQAEQRAAAYYELAASMPGAQPWLLRQAKILKAGIRSKVDSIQFWKGAMESATDPTIREKMRYMLLVLCSQVYWEAPPDANAIRATALANLKELGFNGPIPKDKVPRDAKIDLR